jgi:hypothetical protein
VKNIARLVLFFSLCFAILFLFVVMMRYLRIRIDAVRLFSSELVRITEVLFAAVQWALPAAVYSSLLVSLSYSVRRHISTFLSIIILTALAGAFSVGISMGADRLAHISSPLKYPKVLGLPGLILTQGDNRIISLRGPAEPGSPRVVSLPAEPLIYQEAPIGPDNTILSLPPVPFRSSADWSLQSLVIDLSLTGQQFALRLGEGLKSFLIYGLSLIFLLVSLRFILTMTNWPLANLFLGALAFRGILSLEIFLSGEDVQAILTSFLGDRVPAFYITPLIFSALAVLICLYTSLNWLTVNIQKANDG